MSNLENKHEQKEWNHEQKHREREERIASQKTASGEKKPLREQSQAGRRLLPVVAVVLVLAILAWALFSLGVIQSFVHPISVGSEKVSVVEYNYFYNLSYHQYNQYVKQGLVPANAKGEMDMNALVGIPSAKDLTWGEYLDKMTREQLQRIVILDAEAKKAGFKLPEAREKELNDQIDAAVKQNGGEVAAENSLVKLYGRGMTLDALRSIMKKVYLAQEYSVHLPTTYKVTDEEAQKYYDEHKDEFDLVDYRRFTFSLPPETEKESKASPDEREKLRKEAMDKLHESVQTFMDNVKSEADFIAQAKKFAKPEDKAAYEDDAKTLVAGTSYDALKSVNGGDWLTAKDRKPGDTEVITGQRDYQILYYVKRYRPEEKQPEVGRLLFMLNAAPQDNSPQALEAKAKAEDQLVETAKKSLDNVNDQASLQSEAQRLQQEGDNVYPLWSDSLSFNGLSQAQIDWLKDPARKPGDKTVMKTPNGCELMLFSKAGEKPAWQVAVEQKIRAEKVAKQIEDWEKEDRYKVTVSSIGMYFTDKLAKHTKTGAEIIKESIAAEKNKPTDNASHPVTESSAPAATK